MKKTITILTAALFAFTLTISFSSCGDDGTTGRKGSEEERSKKLSDNPEKNGEEAGECACKSFELDIEKYELKQDQLDTYDDGEIDNREKYAEIVLDIFDIEVNQYDLQKEMQTYRMQVYSGENFHDEDDSEDWTEDFEDAFEDYIEDNCEDVQEDAEDAREDYYERKDKNR